MPSVSSQDFHTSQVSEDDAIGVEDLNDNDLNDNASFASVDDLDGKISDLQGVSVLFHVSISLDEGQTHLLELSNLAAKDPEFYKYLQANDRELLKFDPEATGEDEEMADGDIESEEEKTPTLPKSTCGSGKRLFSKYVVYSLAMSTVISLGHFFRQIIVPFWQHRSLKALRKLLIAFRAAAHMNENDQFVAWSISSHSGSTIFLINLSSLTSSSVYNKLVNTALRYTPVVLEYHVPYKTLTNGK